MTTKRELTIANAKLQTETARLEARIRRQDKAIKALEKALQACWEYVKIVREEKDVSKYNDTLYRFASENGLSCVHFFEEKEAK